MMLSVVMLNVVMLRVVAPMIMASRKKSFLRFAPEDEGLGSAEQERDEPGYHDHLKKY
jgi:hypothetical protein